MFKSRAKRLFAGIKQQRNHSPSQADPVELVSSEGSAVVSKQEYFDFKTCHRTYSCVHCGAHLADHDQLISKLFQGNHGRAYLFNRVVNIGCRQAVQRELLTGLHAVADIYCDNCETTLGWKYEQAFVPSQKYKEGKYIIELIHMLKENNWDLTSYNACELIREAHQQDDLSSPVATYEAPRPERMSHHDESQGLTRKIKENTLSGETRTTNSRGGDSIGDGPLPVPASDREKFSIPISQMVAAAVLDEETTQLDEEEEEEEGRDEEELDDKLCENNDNPRDGNMTKTRRNPPENHQLRLNIKETNKDNNPSETETKQTMASNINISVVNLITQQDQVRKKDRADMIGKSIAGLIVTTHSTGDNLSSASSSSSSSLSINN